MGGDVYYDRHEYDPAKKRASAEKAVTSVVVAAPSPAPFTRLGAATLAEAQLVNLLARSFDEFEAFNVAVDSSAPSNIDVTLSCGEGTARLTWLQLLRGIENTDERTRRKFYACIYDRIKYNRVVCTPLVEAWQRWVNAVEEKIKKQKQAIADEAAKKVAENVKKERERKMEAATTNQKTSTTNNDKTVSGVAGSIVSAIVSATKDDGSDAAWRTAADEALEIGKPVARQLLKEIAGTGVWAKRMIVAVDTPIGEGAVAWLMGWGIMGYGPLQGRALGPKAMRLSKELRVRGIKPITDAIGKKFIRPISKKLTSLIEGLPDADV